MFVLETIRLIDYKVFGNILPKLGILEGIILGIIVCSVLGGIYSVKGKVKK